MSRKNKNGGASAATKKRIGNRILIISLCAFLLAVIIFAATLGIIAAIRQGSYIVSSGFIGLDDGVCSYLSSVYKAQYKGELSKKYNVSDTEAFWNSKDEDGNVFGELLKEKTKAYIRAVVASSALFDKYTTLSSSDRQRIEKFEYEALYRFDSSVSKYNEAMAKYGFDFSDFKYAAELLYKAESAEIKMFGDYGSVASSFYSDCEEFYKKYSHVYLVFVREETTFVLDENGNRVVDENGFDKLRDLTEKERAERALRIEKLTAAANGINEGNVNPERYFELMDEYDEGDRKSHADGYYFMKDAAYTKEFSEAFPEVTAAVEELGVGKCAEVDVSVGKCFIYKVEREKEAYVDTASDWCFSDFFPHIASVVYPRIYKEAADAVSFSELWDSFDPVKIPYYREV